MGRIYYQVIDVTDFGPYVTKLVLGLPAEVRAEDVAPEQFNVYVEVLSWQGEVVPIPKDFLTQDEFIPSRAFRPVTRAYPSTRTGEPLDRGVYITLEMPYGPIYSCSSTLVADVEDLNGHEYYAFSNYRITQITPIGGEHPMQGLVFDTCAGVFNPKRDRFLEDISSDPKIPMRYGYYLPRIGRGKRPLIIFLHGAGEGGTDTAIAYSGNKVTSFTDPDKQEIFGGATVLVPQCETMWLDDGSHTYGAEGVEGLARFSGRSMYTEALKSLIDEFIEKYRDIIDTNRIYVGGDSNGGFMTMRMIMSYPDFFAAAFPICEAMPDIRVSGEDIEHLKRLPIWFTHGKHDPVVAPEDFALPTYQRLIRAGAQNVHLTLLEEIRDIHEGFKNEAGEPYRYFDHFAWIPVLNNDCVLDYDGTPVTVNGAVTPIMNWLALQSR
ncbi:MAG: prolyl oligopeptidase family serine peptidase [Oscillospiraceae bacterium]|nr:prolyl oligopeptidase family serine peptidase [Oscillospiraceae bacterium]